MYDDVEYAKSRLLKTVIRNDKNKLIYVNNVFNNLDGELAVSFSPLSDRDKLGDIKLKKCNLKPLPLGNLQYNDRTYYFTRIPMRQDWRQGSRPNNTIAMGGGFYLDDFFDLHESLQNCVDNIYPSFKECYEMCEDYKSIAFSKKFSLEKKQDKLSLKYKNLYVGEVFDIDNIKLQDDSTYLSEQLIGALNYE